MLRQRARAVAIVVELRCCHTKGDANLTIGLIVNIHRTAIIQQIAIAVSRVRLTIHTRQAVGGIIDVVRHPRRSDCRLLHRAVADSVIGERVCIRAGVSCACQTRTGLRCSR